MSGAFLLLLGWGLAQRALYRSVLRVWGRPGTVRGFLLAILVAGAVGIPAFVVNELAGDRVIS